jgi:hypothetical protein
MRHPHPTASLGKGTSEAVAGADLGSGVPAVGGDGFCELAGPATSRRLQSLLFLPRRRQTLGECSQ